MNKFWQLVLIISLFFIFSSPAYALQMIYPAFPSPSPYSYPTPSSYPTPATPVSSYEIIELPIGIGIPRPTFSPSPVPSANPPQQNIEPYPYTFTPPPFPYPVPPPEYLSPTPPDMIPMNPVSWQTKQVSLTASNFYIQVNGKKYFAKTADLSLHSDPGDRKYTTLEATWHENDVEMRMFMYFKVVDGRWHLYEARTYDGNNPANWIYYGELSDKTPCGDSPCGTILGSSLDLPVITWGDDPNNPQNLTHGTIYFQDLHLQPFLNNKSAPSISTISPNKANQGDRVTLTGSNFTSESQVYVNNILMPKQFYILSQDKKKLSFVLDTEIQFEINKTYDVYVSSEGGSSNQVSLTVTSPARLEKVTPGFGNFGQITQLSGKGFGLSTGSVVFTYKGVWAAAAPILSWNDSRILFRVPAVAGFKTYQIQINMGKQPKGKIAYVSNTMQFDVHEGQPFIQSILPKGAKSGQIVTITGSEFGNKPGKIDFISNSKKVYSAIVKSWAGDKIQLFIPKLTGNTEYQVQITTRDGRQSSIVYYRLGK